MRPILVLAPYVPHPPTHGGSIRSRVLLEALALDHDVHLVVPIGAEVERARAAELARAVRLHVHEVRVPADPGPDFTTKLASWARGRSELLQRRWGDSARAAVAGIAAVVQPALLVADSTFVLPVVPEMAAPLVLHLHNLEHSVFTRAEPRRRSFADRLTRQFEARTIRAAEIRALRRAVLSVTVSESERAVAQSLAPGAKVVCVPNSVDLERLPLLAPPAASPPGVPRLLFVGTMDYPPNLEAVVELVDEHLPVLRAAFPGLVVRLVGRDPGGRLATFAATPGVEVVGPVDDVQPHYAASHAVYLPIRSGGGTRIKVLEAWALGRPVLSTAIGAEALAGTDGEHWCRIESPSQGVEALRAVFAGAGAKLVANGRRLVAERYSHAAAIAALRELVRGIPGVTSG
jgi:glycosyltransferase involved in cell wall biosynthesis